ncbi:MAG: protein TolR [Bdellovibrionota bacterium]
MAMTGLDRGGSYNSRTPTSLAEINVTPLVDVMLVLLIVFMVSAPLMQQGVQVDLPKATGSALDDQQEPLALVITRDKRILINKNDIPLRSLHSKLNAIYGTKAAKEIFIQADQSVSYGFVAQVMAEVKRAGITKLGLVTEPPKTGE